MSRTRTGASGKSSASTTRPSARRWRLPPGLVECIEFHHDPATAPSQPLDVAIVHIANTTAVLAELHSDEFEDAPAIGPVTFAVTGLRRAQLIAVAATASAAVEEVRVLLQRPDPH
jgi:HD-like signal output (HDOD) protein